LQKYNVPFNKKSAFIFSEQSFIYELLAPLTLHHPSAAALQDDAACLSVPQGQELVVTSDTAIANAHFLNNEYPFIIAQRCLHTNLSDLAGMSAQPLCYQLQLTLTHKTAAPEWLSAFCSGLATTQSEFNFFLSGGDTTVHPETLVIGITMLGLAPQGQALRRMTAKAGDAIYVSGTLGDAAAGLQLLLQNQNEMGFLVDRFRTPTPRIALGQQLRGIASAGMDISDGLVLDLERLCAASHVGAIVQADAVPLSPAFQAGGFPLSLALTGGDDYELLFTAPPHHNLSNLPVTKIGYITNTQGVIVHDATGTPLHFTKKGYTHF
jgi:thiamine-monophosphate kinase